MKFAGEKHKNQKVPGTESNYLLHISNVAMEILASYTIDKCFDVNFAVQVAALHDTLEDTNTDIDEINAIFGNKIAAAVSALTKNALLPSKEERMMDSLERINRLEKEVGIVKLADRITNLQPPPKIWSKEKISNYLKQSRLISNQLKGKNDYLNKRLDLKIEAYAKILA